MKVKPPVDQKAADEAWKVWNQNYIKDDRLAEYSLYCALEAYEKHRPQEAKNESIS